MSQIINPGTASGGGFDENGTYPNMTVGEATKATQDGQGRNIASTYATKAEASEAKALHIVSISGTDSSGKSGSVVVPYYSSKKTAYTSYSQLVSEGDALGVWLCSGYFSRTIGSGDFSPWVSVMAQTCTFNADGISIQGLSLYSARTGTTLYTDSFTVTSMDVDIADIITFSDRVAT